MTPNEKPRYKALLIVGAGVMGKASPGCSRTRG